MFKIEKHTQLDKSFDVTDGIDIAFSLPYDDVNHEEVDAHTEAIVEILNKHYEEYKGLKNIKYREHLIKKWNEDKYTREEYPSLEDYLNDYA